jgi:hypothetical protein
MSAMATLGTGPVAGIGRGSNRAGTSASRNQDASTSGRARDVIVPSRRDDGRVVAGTRAGRARSVASRASSATTVTRTRETEVSTENPGGFPGTRVPGDDDDAVEREALLHDPSPLGPYSVWPRVPDAANPATSPRRLFLATVAGALVAETAGQVAERTMVSETARLRLEQRRREIAKGLAKFGFVVVDDRPRQIVSGAEAELSRAGTISGLALVGAMGSRGIAKAKTVAAAARRKREETAMKTRHSATTGAGRVEKNADGDEKNEKSDDAAVAYDVAKTVLFSACYTGLWQPHWFNVLNSYDWTRFMTPGTNPPMPLSATAEALGQSVAPLLANQLVVIPLVYWPAYFLFLGVSERTDVATSLQTLHARLPELMRANLTFWLPAQAVQFAYVPVEDQAVYVAVMGVIWNGILATLSKPGRDAQRRTGAATYGAAAASADEAETEAS